MVGVTSSRGGVARKGAARASMNIEKAVAVSRGNGTRKGASHSAAPQGLSGSALASELESAYAQIDELRQDYRRVQADLAEVKKKRSALSTSSDLSQECAVLRQEVARLMCREKAFAHLLGHIGRTVPEASVALRERFNELHYRDVHPDLDRAVSDGHLSDLYAHWVVQGVLEDRSVAFWPVTLMGVEGAPE